MTVLRGSVPISLIVAFVACASQERINTDCHWTDDAQFVLDPTDRAHRTHLRHDADLMEDLAIRYADAHAGRVARPEWAQTRDACMAKLFAVISDYHRVSEAEIRNWIGRRNVSFDLAVFSAFVVWWSLASKALTRRLFNAWSLRGPVAMFAAATTTLIISAAGGAAGTFWSGFWEVIRIGNEHMSHRAFRSPWPYYVPSIFATAFLACAFFAWREYRVAERRTAFGDAFSDRLLLR